MGEAADYGSVSGSLSGGQAPMATAKSLQLNDGYEQKPQNARKKDAGLTKVAIGHGESEGRYFSGAGFKGQRADEPVRVTVVYFVTPTGQVTQKDMETFSNAFKNWDSQAIWGGSFVVNNN